jgi:Flp pilus assembly protein TadG
MKRVLRTFYESQDGQAVVELALVIPVLLIVVLGIVDFGKAINYWNDENHLANLGARYAAVGTWPEETCKEGTKEFTKPTLVQYLKCRAYTDSPELTEGGGANGVQAGVSVCVKMPAEPKVGEPVTVSVAAKYKWLPYPPIFGKEVNFGTSTLTGTATMRLEQVSPKVTEGSTC